MTIIHVLNTNHVLVIFDVMQIQTKPNFEYVSAQEKAIDSEITSQLQHIQSTKDNIIQLLPLSEGDMTICSPEPGNIARGRNLRAT